MSDEHDDRDPEDNPRVERNRFQRLSDQLTGLLDPESAFRRGQGIVTGVTSATKEELMRLVGAEVRRFLDKMDISDLAQQIIEGLVVDVNMQVKFSRSSSGAAEPQITKSEASVRADDEGETRKDRPVRSDGAARTSRKDPPGKDAVRREPPRTERLGEEDEDLD